MYLFVNNHYQTRLVQSLTAKTITTALLNLSTLKLFAYGRRSCFLVYFRNCPDQMCNCYNTRGDESYAQTTPTPRRRATATTTAPSTMRTRMRQSPTATTTARQSVTSRAPPGITFKYLVNVVRSQFIKIIVLF